MSVQTKAQVMSLLQEYQQELHVTVHSPSGYQRENKTFAIFSEGGVNNYNYTVLVLVVVVSLARL